MKYKSISSVAICALVAACGPVGQSDSSFWEPGHDVGGTQYDFANAGHAGAAGQPVTGPMGTGNVPQQGAGGGAAVGGGPGQGGGPPPPGAGGYVSVPGGGGAPPQNFGGMNPGTGGAMQGAGGAGVDPPPTGNSGPCDFTFNVTTVTARGQFAPRNVGALWIQDSNKKFVKSLEVWGKTRLPNLTTWVSVSGNNTVDAVTSATINSHVAHSRHWNCSDVNKASVVNGTYQACVSMTESDTIPIFGVAPPMFCAPFNKGSGPATSSPPDQPNFVKMQLIMN